MKFLIQNNLLSKDQLSKTNFAVLDLPHQFVNLVPFSRELLSDGPILGQEWIPYGSTVLIEEAYSRGWKGLCYNPETFSYEKACKNRNDMLNDFYIFNVPTAIEYLERGPKEELWFVRPDSDLKLFSGRVDIQENIVDFLKDALQCESSGSYKLSPDTKIVLANPVYIFSEWRAFIVNRKIVSVSMYRSRGELYSDRELSSTLLAEFQVMASKWLPHKNCVMDIALTLQGLKVIEFNCINASGFYDNDAKAILTALYHSETDFQTGICGS